MKREIILVKNNKVRWWFYTQQLTFILLLITLYYASLLCCVLDEMYYMVVPHWATALPRDFENQVSECCSYCSIIRGNIMCLAWLCIFFSLWAGKAHYNNTLSLSDNNREDTVCTVNLVWKIKYLSSSTYFYQYKLFIVWNWEWQTIHSAITYGQ